MNRALLILEDIFVIKKRTKKTSSITYNNITWAFYHRLPFFVSSNWLYIVKVNTNRNETFGWWSSKAVFCLFFKVLKRFYLFENIELWMFWILCLDTEMVFTFMLVLKWCMILDFGCLFQSYVVCWILLGSLKHWVGTYFLASRNFFPVKGLVQVRTRSIVDMFVP